MIDAKNLKSIILCEENLINSNFIAGCSEVISEGPDYAIISQIDPICVIGAMPSAFIAFALGLPERSFILNPVYREVFNFGKIKEISDILLFATFYTLALKYPNLSIGEVYKKFPDSDVKLVTAQSSETMTAGSSTFFHRQPSVAALDPTAYSSHLKF